MEAKLVQFSPEMFLDAVGEIAVIVTKEEWVEVIQAVTYMARNDTSEELVHRLINRGVYE